MLIGAHTVLYSANAAADRAFLRDVLGLAGVDAGEGFLIFALPPAEVAVHEAEGEAGRHELYFQCANANAFAGAMHARDVACSPVQELHWGRLMHVTLPGGSRIGVYEPRHARPHTRRRAVRRAAGKKAAQRPKQAARRGARRAQSRQRR